MAQGNVKGLLHQLKDLVVLPLDLLKFDFRNVTKT